MCTSIQMNAQDGGILFARTMDWHSFPARPITIPKAYQWQSVYSGQHIQNTYAILGVGRDSVHGHADISDGVNEHGLAAQKLTFSNASQYVSQPQAGLTHLAAFEFVLCLLGNCRSVADALEKIQTVQLMTDEFSNLKFGRNDLHFSLTDPTGRLISIEPFGGSLVVKENPIGVVTNAPKLENEIEKLKPYLDLDFSASGLNQISTGNFSGKSVFPGGFTPTNRFIRATVLKERAVVATNERQNVIETWHILNSVTVPKSEGRSDTYTIYRSAVDLKSKTLYFQAYDDLAISQYSFPE